LKAVRRAPSLRFAPEAVALDGLGLVIGDDGVALDGPRLAFAPETIGAHRLSLARGAKTVTLRGFPLPFAPETFAFRGQRPAHRSGLDSAIVRNTPKHSHDMTITDPTLAAFAAPASHVPRVLTIAGSDSGGGAGIQADLKTFAALGCYGMSAITAITAQNTQGVTAVESLTPDIVAAQIDAVASDIGVDAAKTGMLGTPQVVEAILSALDRHPIANLVVDPVMVSTSGAQLGSDATVQAMAKWLFPRALLVTPNLPEASALLGREVRSAEDMLPAARDLLALGPRAVLLKGGHLADVASAGEAGVLQDVLVTADGIERVYAHTYIDTPHTHGTGCTLSAAIAAHLARGDSLETAIEASLDYLLHAIGAGRHLALGKGAGPLNHGFAPRPLAAPRALAADVDED
jgi:hydroxymethylpyrimidine/phosphomethylpyrimidine kinase